MTEKKQTNPLYGLKMDVLLTEISEHYGWELLSETLEINRFQFHTGMNSTVKFLRNNEWAKDKVENFYLYQYKNFPCPDDKQLSIAPRNRLIPAEQIAGEPAQITAEVIEQINKASKSRNYKTVSSSDQSSKNFTQRTEEPPYNPSNPWNK